MDTIGERIIYLRKKRGLTQERLSALSGVAQPTLSRIEKGRVQEPEKIFEIARALRVNAYFLKTGQGSETGSQPPPELDSALVAGEPEPKKYKVAWPFRTITPTEWAQLDDLERDHVEMSARILLKRSARA